MNHALAGAQLRRLPRSTDLLRFAGCRRSLLAAPALGRAALGRVHAENALLAAWSMKMNIAWPRFLVAMTVLACMIVAAAWLENKQGKKK
jgi:hypothetical protein